MELQECYEKYVAEFGNGSWLPSKYTDEEVQSAYKTIQSFIEYSFIIGLFSISCILGDCI